MFQFNTIRNVLSQIDWQCLWAKNSWRQKNVKEWFAKGLGGNAATQNLKYKLFKASVDEW